MIPTDLWFLALALVVLVAVSGVIRGENEKNKLWLEKLTALLDGMECENISFLIQHGKTGDYKRLGEMISERIKELSK